MTDLSLENEFDLDEALAEIQRLRAQLAAVERMLECGNPISALDFIKRVNGQTKEKHDGSPGSS